MWLHNISVLLQLTMPFHIWTKILDLGNSMEDAQEPQDAIPDDAIENEATTDSSYLTPVTGRPPNLSDDGIEDDSIDPLVDAIVNEDSQVEDSAEDESVKKVADLVKKVADKMVTAALQDIEGSVKHVGDTALQIHQGPQGSNFCDAVFANSNAGQGSQAAALQAIEDCAKKVIETSQQVQVTFENYKKFNSIDDPRGSTLLTKVSNDLNAAEAVLTAVSKDKSAASTDDGQADELCLICAKPRNW